MDITLYDWAPSPFCMKVRAVLHYKSIPFRRVNAAKHLREIRKRCGWSKTPVLEIDGTMIVDSTDIVYELERRVPTPTILPATARDRAACHALEDWTDESLYVSGLYYHWHDADGRKQVRQLFGPTLRGWLAHRYFSRAVMRQLRGQGILGKTPTQVRRDLERHVDAAEGLVHGRDFLLEGGPFLCDFALMSQLVYLQRAPGASDLLEGRPGIAGFLARMRALRER
jgi:glutathione S-transferase